MKDLLYQYYGLEETKKSIGTTNVDNDFIVEQCNIRIQKIDREWQNRGYIDRFVDDITRREKRYFSERFITYDEYLDIIIDKYDYDYNLVHYRVMDIDNEFKRQRLKESYKESIEDYVLLMKNKSPQLFNFFF